MDQKILQQAVPSQQTDEQAYGAFEYILPVYEKIVFPFIGKIKELMI